MNQNDVINEHGISRMMLHNKWIAREAPKRGLRDPWKHRPDGLLSREEIMAKIAGVDVPATRAIYKECTQEELNAWKIERDEYMRQRDEWIALQMFHKYGYEIFLAECKAYSLTEEFLNSVRPCDSLRESQCNLFCQEYEICEQRMKGGEN